MKNRAAWSFVAVVALNGTLAFVGLSVERAPPEDSQVRFEQRAQVPEAHVKPADAETLGQPDEGLRFPLRYAGNLYFVEKVIKRGGENAGFEIDVRYPQLGGSGDRRVLLFNRAVERAVYEEYKWLARRQPSKQHTADQPGIDSTNISFDIPVAEPDGIISVAFHVVTTAVGAASALQSDFTIAFNFRTGRLLQLSDLFAPDSNYLEVISKACIAELIRKSDRNGGPYYLDGSHERALQPKSETFRNWTLDPEGISFTFDECSIVACMHGSITLTVPFEALEHVLEPDSPYRESPRKR